MQKAITNTQSELNLEVQRQADATSSLREQLEATIAEMEQKEVQECLNAVQGEQQLPSAEAVPQDATVQVDPEETRKIIDRSIQSAVDVICKTIRDEVREVTARAAQPKPQVSSVNHGNTTKDDKSDGDDEDYELERRMQEAWRKTYLVVSSSVSQPEASTDQEPSKKIVRVSQNSTCSTDNESSGEIIAVSPRSSAHRELPTPLEVTIVLQESSTPVVGGVVLTQPNQAQEYAQQQTNSPRHDEPQAERVNLRSVVSEIQLQIAVRAEMAARRYLSKKAAISELPIDVRARGHWDHSAMMPVAATGSWSSDFTASMMQTSATGSWRSRMTASAAPDSSSRSSYAFYADTAVSDDANARGGSLGFRFGCCVYNKATTTTQTPAMGS
ncbi:hypothetical protein GQ600_27860 [Phytophthora cactorum]|nr:hypothetical protein GQ600_27860 [Phytophthora cactorum]